MPFSSSLHCGSIYSTWTNFDKRTFSIAFSSLNDRMGIFPFLWRKILPEPPTLESSFILGCAVSVINQCWVLTAEDGPMPNVLSNINWLAILSLTCIRVLSCVRNMNSIVFLCCSHKAVSAPRLPSCWAIVYLGEVAMVLDKRGMGNVVKSMRG